MAMMARDWAQLDSMTDKLLELNPVSSRNTGFTMPPLTTTCGGCRIGKERAAGTEPRHATSHSEAGVPTGDRAVRQALVSGSGAAYA